MSSLDPNARSFWNTEELWQQYGQSDSQQIRKGVVESLLPTDVRTILDVGAGKGEIINDLLPPYQPIALDVSSVALAYVRCPRVLGAIEALPFVDHSFDLVMCLEVLEHLTNEALEVSARELARVSKGWLMIGVPYCENLSQRLTRCPSCGRVFHADTHLRRFGSVDQLSALFPQHRVNRYVLAGPKSRRRTRLGVRLQQEVGKVYVPWRSHFFCAWCGFHTHDDSETPKPSLYTRAWLKLNYWLAYLNEPLPQWLIVLLQRT
jgi:SAM-dependent methyltransferase